MSVLLNWTAYPGATAYGVYRTTDLTVPFTLLASVSSPTYTDTTALITGVYWYYIIAYNGGTPLSGSYPVTIGAAQQRVGQICSKILRMMKSKNQVAVTADELIAEMEQVQLELCRDNLAYRIEFAISMIAAQMNYPLPSYIYKVREMIPPTTWCRIDRKGMRVISDPKQYSRALNARNYYYANYPVEVYFFNNILRFIPAPSVTGDIVAIIAYGLPQIGNLQLLGDPIISQEWDDCLMYETHFRASGDQSSHELYEEKRSKIAMQNYKEAIQGDLLVDDVTREIGF